MADAPPDTWDGLLEKGEVILWQGRPNGALNFSGVWGPQTLFALLFTGFSLFWMVMAYSMTGGMNDSAGRVIHIVFPAFGLPFLLIGLYLLLGRFWADARRRRASHYTLTNRAAYIGVQTGKTRRLDRYAIDAKTRMTLEEGALGTVWFARQTHVMPRHAPRIGRARSRIGGATQTTETIGFERIPDARTVFALMRQVQTDRITRAEEGDDA